MNDKKAPVNGIAQLRNVALCYQAVTATQNAHQYTPKLAVLYGRSGDGKSLATVFVAIRAGAYRVQVQSCWTKKYLLEMILKERGIPPEKTVPHMVDQVARQLSLSRRPLIIDEFDHLVTGSKLELVRDIYDASQSTILLVGEELLPRKLEKWERFHGRVLNWVQAAPCNEEDARLLLPIYAPNLTVADEVLTQMVQAVRGSTRRVATNLSRLRELAVNEDEAYLDMTMLTALGFAFATGDSPKPRAY